MVILTNGDDSLFLVNDGQGDFPLAPLELKNQRGEVSGEEWEVEFLRKGQCVAVWKDSRKPKPPKKLQCAQVGKHLERDQDHRFWTSEYEVFYNDERIEICKEYRDCKFKIELRD